MVASKVEVVTAAVVWCVVLSVGTRGQTPAPPPPPRELGLTPSGNQQNLQTVLYSIEERLRALDLSYSTRYGGRWDFETHIRRLEAIEARMGRLESLLEIRTEKLLEGVSSHQMKETLANEHTNRKIDSLYDRVIHRIGHMENRIDMTLGKIQSSIESGLVRISRTERESEIIDVETQLHDLQRQFEDFEKNQNQTLTLLIELFTKGSMKTVLNDEENVDRESFKRDMEQFSASMENIATKVNKMFNEFNHQSQTLEGLVKNSMSLTNATRREVQEGFKTLGQRKIVMQQGNKQNKEKEAAISLEGWDALSNLLSKEFGNLVRKIDSNYEELTKDHNMFIDGCHRVQENESQLEAEIAGVLERILDRIQNRSHDMEKQVVALQDMLKSHNSNVIRTISHSTNMALQSTQYTKQLEATILETMGQHKDLEKLGEGLTNVLAGLKVLQNQVVETPAPSSTSGNNAEVCPESCPDSAAIAENILKTILQQNFTGIIGNTEGASRLIAEKILATLKCTQATISKSNAEILSVTGDMRSLDEAYIQGVINRTIEFYQESTKMHDQGVIENIIADESKLQNFMETPQCNNTISTLEYKHSTIETGNGKNGNHRSNIMSDKGSVLDIPVTEEHLGDTMEYNVTTNSGPVLPPSEYTKHNTAQSEPVKADILKVTKNVTVIRKGAEDNQKTSQDEEMNELEVDKMKTNAREDDAEEEKREFQEEINGSDITHLNEDVESGTEVQSDYDLDKTSSELDKSEQLYYDDLTEGAIDDEQPLKNHDETEINTLETSHPLEMMTVTPNTLSQTIKLDTGSKKHPEYSHFEPEYLQHSNHIGSAQPKQTILSQTEKNIEVGPVNKTDENVKGYMSMIREKENNTSDFLTHVSFENSTYKNTGSESNIHMSKIIAVTEPSNFNKLKYGVNESTNFTNESSMDIADISEQGFKRNTTHTQKMAPAFSRIWNRIVGKVNSENVETSTVNTLTNLSLNSSRDKKTEVEPKGQYGSENVNNKSANNTERTPDFTHTPAVHDKIQNEIEDTVEGETMDMENKDLLENQEIIDDYESLVLPSR